MTLPESLTPREIEAWLAEPETLDAARALLIGSDDHDDAVRCPKCLNNNITITLTERHYYSISHASGSQIMLRDDGEAEAVELPTTRCHTCRIDLCLPNNFTFLT